MTVAFFTFLVIGAITLRSSPLPVLLGVTAMPLVSLFYEPLTVTLGFLAIFLILVVKRLTVPRAADAVSVSRGQLLLNRLLFDRDIRDRQAWMFRVPEAGVAKRPERKKG